MMRKSLFVLFSLFSIFAAAVSAQETESAVSSDLTGVSLPANAQRVLPNYVPAEITDTLDKIVAEGNGKVRKGGTEVLIWADANYSKANAGTIIYRLTDTLKIDGWQYSVEGSEDGVTVFSLFKERGGRRAIIGFYGATDEALIFAWMELLAGNGGTTNDRIDDSSSNNRSGNSGGSIVGTWTNGTASTISEKNLSTGQINSRGGSSFKYVFRADGTFEAIGLMSSTMYGCTTDLFNDKRGRYEISGSQITFTLTKNFWRNTYSCSPQSNKEKNHTLGTEVYTWRTKIDEYGKQLICLTNDKGEACYRKE